MTLHFVQDVKNGVGATFSYQARSQQGRQLLLSCAAALNVGDLAPDTWDNVGHTSALRVELGVSSLSTSQRTCEEEEEEEEEELAGALDITYGAFWICGDIALGDNSASHDNEDERVHAQHRDSS